MGGRVISGVQFDVQILFMLVSIFYYFYNTYGLHIIYIYYFCDRKRNLIIEP